MEWGVGVSVVDLPGEQINSLLEYCLGNWGIGGDFEVILDKWISNKSYKP